MSSPAPNSPSWDHSGEPDPAGGAFADTGAPERLTQIWQATWDWMKGLPTAPPKLLVEEKAGMVEERAELLYATVTRTNIFRDSGSVAQTIVRNKCSCGQGPSSEARRVGAAYALGRAAAAGCDESLAALLTALQCESEQERAASLSLWGSDTQRAAMHGLSTGGDAAAEALLPFLLDSGTSPAVLGAAATALGEAALNPTEEMVAAFATVMARLRGAILDEGFDAEITVEETKLQRHRGTAFCSQPFRETYTSANWQSLAAAAVGLWHLAQRAVAVGDAAVCAAAAEAAIPFTEAGIELGPQCRQNAAGALLSLSVCEALPPATRERLTLTLARLGTDDDRYVRAAALHAVVRDAAGPLRSRGGSRAASAIGDVFGQLVERRWCPISGLGGLSRGASF